MNIFLPIAVLATVFGFCGQFGRNAAPSVEEKPAANRAVNPTQDREAVKRELVALAKEIATAAKEGDVTFLAKVTTDDFQLTDVDGKVQNKNQALLDVKEEKQIKSFDITDENLVSLDEDSAVLSYTLKVVAKNGRSAKAKTTDTYVKKAGTWLLKTEQQTLIR